MRKAMLVVAMVLGVGCGGAEPGSGSVAGESQALSTSERDLKVVSQNLYLGADLVPAFAVTSLAELPPVVSAIYAQMVANDYPARAQRLADELAKIRPHVIGLQEAELIRAQVPGDFFVGNPVAATQVVADYAAILVAALHERGLDYREVAVFDGTDVELPAANGADLRLTDREVLLARSDVAAANGSGSVFVANATVQLGGAGGPTLQLRRGYVEADVSFGDAWVHVASAHLEAFEFPQLGQLQIAQASQLMADLAAQPLPAVMLGDFNSAADGSTTPTYAFVTAAGFEDAWALSHPGARGFTCCQAADLSNHVSQLDERIDYVFLWPGAVESGLKVEAALLGAHPDARRQLGLWPSDHAGLAATLAFPSLAPVLARAR